VLFHNSLFVDRPAFYHHRRCQDDFLPFAVSYHAFVVSHHAIEAKVQVGFPEFVKGVLSPNQGLQELQVQREEMMVSDHHFL